jgi:hypothetical protein
MCLQGKPSSYLRTFLRKIFFYLLALGFPTSWGVTRIHPWSGLGCEIPQPSGSVLAWTCDLGPKGPWLRRTTSAAANNGMSITIIPLCSAASFQVNSEPHTGARPSVRLCVGPELARCVHILKVILEHLYYDC